jgi:hypothetical protein
MALTSSLAVVEVAQYIIYSTSREHSVGRLQQQDQVNAAQSKYQSLIRNPAFASLFTSGWFELPAQLPANSIRSGYGNNFFTDYPGRGTVNRKSMQGVSVDLQFHILTMKLPLLGNVQNEDGSDSFSSRILAVIRREPTAQECINFMKARKDAFWSVENGRSAILNKNRTVVTPWEDNGC